MPEAADNILIQTAASCVRWTVDKVLALFCEVYLGLYYKPCEVEVNELMKTQENRTRHEWNYFFDIVKDLVY
jgi:hypothetical protein